MVHGILSCLLHSQHSLSQDMFPSNTEDCTDDHSQLSEKDAFERPSKNADISIDPILRSSLLAQPICLH